MHFQKKLQITCGTYSYQSAVNDGGMRRIYERNDELWKFLKVIFNKMKSN